MGNICCGDTDPQNVQEGTHGPPGTHDQGDTVDLDELTLLYDPDSFSYSELKRQLLLRGARASCVPCH